MDENDIPKSALELWKKDHEHWGPIYDQAKEDLHFLSDDPCAQWSETDYNERITRGSPALTFDQLSQFVHQVANDIRQNTPTFTVIPDDSESSEDDAEAFRAIIRGIEYKSNADDVYDTAALNSVKSSIGFIRVDHDYCDDNSFDQELKIQRVINPLACSIDRDSIECDGRDAMHGHIIDKMKVSTFKKKYPGKDPVSFEGEGKPCQKDDEDIQICEFFKIVENDKTITFDEYGKIVEVNEVPEGLPSRKIKKRSVMRYKLSGKEVLEETRFPGIYIPLIPVYGEEHWIEGKRNLFSLIRKAKDPQRMYNVWRSLETELLLKQPQAPVMAAEGAVEEYAEDWKKPGKTMVLRYKTKDVEGNDLPPPQRLEPPTITSGFINAAKESVDDIKSSMGLYNASIGARSNETSGIAIQRRQQEGDVATFHFYDNLVRSITHVYRVLIHAIPEIYDTPRILRAIGKEEEPITIGVNGQKTDNQDETIDLTKGKYTVRVVPGAPFTTKRQEAAQFFTEIVTKQPELMQVMGDLLFKYSDFAGSEAMAERMKKVIDPKFLEEEEREIDPEKEEMKALIEQGAQEVQALQAEIQQKETEANLQKQLDEIKAANERLKSQEQLARLTIENLKKDLEIQKLQAQQDIEQMAEQELASQVGQQVPENELAPANTTYGQ